MIMTLTYERNLNSDIVKKLKEEISEKNLNKIYQTNVILRTNLKKLRQILLFSKCGEMWGNAYVKIFRVSIQRIMIIIIN